MAEEEVEPGEIADPALERWCVHIELFILTSYAPPALKNRAFSLPPILYPCPPSTYTTDSRALIDLNLTARNIAI
jgi:hypothetical protein